MCGIWGILGKSIADDDAQRILRIQEHRGPDNGAFYHSPSSSATLLHNRLSIIDLTNGGNQPMTDPSGRYTIVFNGEVYNYLELREELKNKWTFKTKSDTEVLLAGFIIYGKSFVHKLNGMFAFAVWDEQDRTSWIVRDRFGVKPCYYNKSGNDLIFSSEIKGIHEYGIGLEMNDKIWAGFLTKGLYGQESQTFWNDIYMLLPGHELIWKNGNVTIQRWYDFENIVGQGFDERPIEKVVEEYDELLQDSLRLRFRSDVSVGVNISGGLDSSLLIGMVDRIQKNDHDVKAFTFNTGDSNYDELPWVQEIIKETNHPLINVQVSASEIPALAQATMEAQDEPFGGIPTICYFKLFQTARELGTIVLLDGQGMDEQWAGYDYYQKITNNTSILQGTKESPLRPNVLADEFLAIPNFQNIPKPFNDPLKDTQYRDIFYTKIPRALQFNDRVSMANSCELREPFLDHRLFELAIRQKEEYKINGDQGKYFLRRYMAGRLPNKITEAPKRALQTPQREWLRGELKDWATDLIETACNYKPEWLVKKKVLDEWNNFLSGGSDNSFYIWQWICLGMTIKKISNEK